LSYLCSANIGKVAQMLLKYIGKVAQMLSKCIGKVVWLFLIYWY